MRVLPRSRRGIWLFAGAVWCAACGVLWWGLPVVPRAEWPAPEGCWPLGFVDENRTLVTCSVDMHSRESLRHGPIQLWNCKTNATACCGQSTDQFSAAALSPDGRRLAISPMDVSSAIRIIDLPSGDEVGDIPRTIPGSVIYEICYSPNGRFIAFFDRGHAESHLRIWDVAGRRLSVSIPLSSGKPIENYGFGSFAIAWSPNGHNVAVADPGDSSRPLMPKVIVWSIDSGQVVRTWAGPVDLTILQVHFSPDGRFVGATFKTANDRFNQFRSTLATWEVATGAKAITISDDVIGLSAGFSWTYNRVGGMARRLRVFGFGDETPVIEFPLEKWDRLIRPVLADDGKTLTLNSESFNTPAIWLARRGLNIPGFAMSTNEICIVNGKTRQEIAQIPLPRRSDEAPPTVNWMALSPDAAVYAVCESEKLRLWDIPPHKSLTWLAAGAAIVALPIALAAWRRGRKLRAA